MKTTTHVIGSFQVTSGELVIIDPCYSDIERLGTVIPNAVKGLWLVQVEALVVEGESGYRTASLKAMLEGAVYDHVRFIDNLGVDSGTLGIFDLDIHPQFLDNYVDQGDWCTSLFELTRGDMPVGVLPGGVVSSSGFGDGGYAATLFENVAGQVVGIEITFIDEGELRNWEANWNF